MHGLCGYAENLSSTDTLNVHSCDNPIAIIYIRCIDCPELQEIKYLELRKSNEKLCTLDVQIVSICEKSQFYRYIKCTKLR